MIVVIVVLEVRRVTVDQRVPVLVEPVKDPEPGEAAEAVRPKLVKRARLVEGEALVRDAVAAAACGFGGGSCECSVRRGVGIEEEPRGARWEWTARRTPARRRVSRDLGFPRSGSKGEGGKGRTHGAGLLRERTRRELRRGLTRDRLTQRAGRETHGGTRRHPASPRSKGPSADE